jgi:2OG-Fe(II) oxygenase superfamily
MPVLRMNDRGGLLAFDKAECEMAGSSFYQAYTQASPFPHVVIDDFIATEVLQRVIADFPSSQGRSYYDDGQTRLKYLYGPPDIESGFTRNLLSELTGQAFLGFLENMTGIKGLLTDTSFDGAGLHETKAGGRLNVHADFTMQKTLRVERRLNLLVYLNGDWRPEYHGELELWDNKMKACEVSVAPILGRAVVFSTTRDSYHGQPDPVTCPPEMSRKSIATYYYTAAESGIAAIPDRLTDFQVRPGSKDERVRGLWREHLMRDWVPPRILQAMRRR